MSEKEEAELVEQELEIDRLEGERNDWKAKAGILTAEVKRYKEALQNLYDAWKDGADTSLAVARAHELLNDEDPRP